jgi:hypothetical protein
LAYINLFFVLPNFWKKLIICVEILIGSKVQLFGFES